MSTKIRIATLITGLVLLFFNGNAQDSTLQKPVHFVVKPSYLTTMIPQGRNGIMGNRSMLIDSINNELIILKSQNDSLLMLLNEELSHVSSLEKETARLKEANQNLEKELELTHNDQLKTSHTSSILLIFNIIAGIILLVALLWIFSRKKSDSVSQQQKEIKVSTTPSTDQMETKMERIEKLGKLRDKGLLTDEEFLLQKKHILG